MSANPAVWLIAFVLTVVAVYVLVRVGAIAWFRTRAEHSRQIMREMKGEGRDDG